MTSAPPVKARPALLDMELAALSAAGDRAAFGELVRRHGTPVRALLRRMGATPAEADDVAQDAFIAAFERIGGFRGDGTFSAWVRRIAARHYARRARRRLEVELAAAPIEVDEADGVGESGAADRLDLDAALASLSPAERACVSMCCGAGLTHGEAAEALGTPVGTVKSHVRRGLEKLRRRMGAPPGPGQDPRAPARVQTDKSRHDV